ncbi:MAG TPA: ABC transporter permease [Xanthomonadales bacterium]|nr:ABC transporter permease [Xanthomonadales bacterium]
MNLIRQTIKGLIKAQGYSWAVITTMAVAIGACTAVFSLVYSVLLQPLPFESPERLVAVKEVSLTDEMIAGDASSSIFVDWREMNQTFEDLTAFGASRLVLDPGDGPISIDGLAVYPNFHQVLGIQPMLGRGFALDDAAELQVGTNIVISHRLWTDLWGQDPEIIGQTIRLNDNPVEVIGVMPRSDELPALAVDVYVPTGFSNQVERWERYDRWLWVVGRLAPGVSQEQAAADLAHIDALLEEDGLADIYSGAETRIFPLDDYISGGVRASLLAALGATALVLLLACANIASLTLARATTRAGELAVRAALGANRRRLIQIVLTETLVLGALGGAIGVGLAAILQPALLSFQPELLPRVGESSVGIFVMLVGWLTSLITAVVFGLIPAYQAGRMDLQSLLSEGGRSLAGGKRASSLRVLLVAGQVALAVTLLSASGSLIYTLNKLQNSDPGFQSDGVLAARVYLGQRRYPEDHDVAQYIDSVLEKLNALPGVASATAASTLPMDPLGTNYDLPVKTENMPAGYEGALPQVDYRIVTPDFFRTLGVPLLQGRTFDSTDTDDSPGVIVVTRALAEQLWPGEDAVGKRINTPAYDWEWFEVIGVVGDTSYYGLGTERRPEMFTSFSQFATHSFSFAIRAEGEFEGLAGSMRRALLEVDPIQPAYNVLPLTSLVEDSIATEKFFGFLLTVFAMIALVVAAAGVYGTLAYWVSQRRFELGIRLALGASRKALVGTVMRTGMKAVGGGLLLGLGGAVLASQVVARISPSVISLSGGVLGATLLVLTVVAVFSCLVPALGASRIQPSLVLKR